MGSSIDLAEPRSTSPLPSRRQCGALMWSNQSVVLTQCMGGRAATHTLLRDGSFTLFRAHFSHVRFASNCYRIAVPQRTSKGSSNPMMEGPWCRFRREARAREQHQHRGGG